MNGSAALAQTPPTKIPPEDVVGIVIFGLSYRSVNDPKNLGEKYEEYYKLFQQVKIR